MALPNPTALVSASLTIGASDLITSASIVNHLIPSVTFKSINVQYRGYINIAANSTYSFAPETPAQLWAVVFLRNLGGQGSGNVLMNWTPSGVGAQNVVNLDVGAMFLYISPTLAALAIAPGVVPGITQVQLSTPVSTSGNFEILLAA